MGKTFMLYGMELQYDTSLENFNYIALNIRRIKAEMKRDFSNSYYKKFSNMDDVINGITDFQFNYVFRAFEWGLKFLNSNNVFTYDQSRMGSLMREHGLFDYLVDVDEKIENEYIEIIQDKEEAAEYRRQRKEARGRWQGGGFGVQGALQGAMTAGAANMASGLAHSTVNALGNITSGINAGIQKNKMYKSKVDAYMDATAVTIESVIYAVGYIMNQESEHSVKGPDREDVENGDAIIGNIKQGYLTGRENILENCAMVLEENPYNEEAYVILRQMFDDPEEELDKLASYFGITSVYEYKQKKIKEILSDINYYSEEGIEEGREKFFEWAKKYGIDILPYYDCLDQVKKLVLEYKRTVDDHVYDSVEKAEEMKTLLYNVLERIKAISGNRVEEIHAVIAELETGELASKGKYIAYLNRELESEDQRYRTVKGVLYETRDAAYKVRTEVSEIDEIIEKGFLSSEEISEAKAKISELTAEDLRQLYLEYMNECEMIWNCQDIEKYKQSISGCALRKDLATQYYLAAGCLKKASALKSVNKEFEQWFLEFKNRYVTVNQKVYDMPEAADKAYLKWVNHASSYLEYITEKNTKKKSLFSSLKTGLTGIVYKNYEEEYNALTENGTKPIPKDQKTDQQAIDTAAKVSQDLANKFVAGISDKYQRVFMTCMVEDKILNADGLYVTAPEITADTIKNIMKEVCAGITVKERKKE